MLKKIVLTSHDKLGGKLSMNILRVIGEFSIVR